MKPVKELGFFAVGMSINSGAATNYTVTALISTIDDARHEKAYLHEMIGKGIIVEFDNERYLYTDNDWVDLPMGVICINSEKFEGYLN